MPRHTRGLMVLCATAVVGLVGSTSAVPALAAPLEPTATADTSGNTLLAAAHTDMAPVLGQDGELKLVFHQDTGNYDPATTVVEVPDTAAQTVPEPRLGADYDFMAPAGTRVWILPETQDPALVWLGWSSQRVPVSDYQPPLTMRFEGVTGPDGGAPPGELVLSDDNAPDGGKPLISTREGLPNSLTMPPNIHKHLNWTFTAPGTYCLGVTAEGVLADGHLSTGSSVLTFVVGEEPGLDPTTVETCEQRGVDTTGATLVEPDRSNPTGRALIQPRPRVGAAYGTNTYATLRPTLATDGLGLELVEGTQVDGGIAHDPAATVLAVDARNKVTGASTPYWNLTPNVQAAGGTTLYYDTTRIPANAVAGPLTWRLTDSRAPGEFSLDQYDSTLTGWSTVPGAEADAFTTRTGQGNWFASARFYSDGVYCLDFDVSAERAGGTPVSASSTLVVAVAVNAPGQVSDADCGHTAAEVNAAQAQPDPDPEPAVVGSTTTTTVTGAVTYGTAHGLQVDVTTGAYPAPGAVAVSVDGAEATTAALAEGRASIELPATLPAGQHVISVSYPGATTETGERIDPSASTVTLNIAPAATTTTVKLTKKANKQLRQGKQARVTVQVGVVGVAGMPATGRVVVYDRKRKLRTIVLTDHGIGRLRLPRSHAGDHRSTHRLRFVYAGSADLLGSTATVRLRIRR